MANTSREQLKAWFRRGMKPLQSQFAAWIDSFWHKDDSIPMASIEGLADALNNIAVPVDDTISGESENPVQNKVIKTALDGKAATVHHHDEYAGYGDIADLQAQIDLLAQREPSAREVITVATADDLDDIEEPSTEVIYKTLDESKLWLYDGERFNDVTGRAVYNYIYVADISVLLLLALDDGIYSVLVVEGSAVSATYSLSVANGGRVLANQDGWALAVESGGSSNWQWHRYSYQGHTHTIAEITDLPDIFNPELYYTKEEIDNKGFAKTDGVYDNMTVGFAKNLLGRETDSVVDDSSFTFRSTAGTTSIAENAVAQLASIKGNLTRVGGVLYPFTADSFKAVGLNAFNKNNTAQQRAGYKIDNSGNIVADSDFTLVWLHCLEGTSGSGYNNGYIVKLCGDSHSVSLGNVGFSATKPTTETASVTRLTASANNNSTSFLPPTDGWLLVSVPTANLADLCVHLAWSGYNDSYTIFREYSESVVYFAGAVPNVWGMGKVGSVSDEINFAEKKAYRRVGRVYMQDLNWTAKYEEQESEGETVQVLVGYTTAGLANIIKASTLNIAADTVSGVTGYTADANGVVTAYTGSETTFSGAMYFELATPDELTISISGNYTSDDFGTEEFADTTIDGYATIKYNTNLIDSIRALVNSGVSFNSVTLTTFNGTILPDSDYELGTISALNVQHVPTDGFFESNVFFTAGSGFALTLPSGTKLIGEIPEFTAGVEYVLSVYKGRVTIAAVTVTA